MRASSQIINFTALIKRVSLLLHEMLHVEDSSSLIGILNHECVVLPPVIKRAVILKDVTAKAILLCDLIFVSNVLYKNIFLISPGLSTKKYLDA